MNEPTIKKMAVIAESKVKLWSTSTWQFEREILIGTPAVNSVAFSADGKWLAVGAADRKIRLFLVIIFEGHMRNDPS